MIGKAAGSPRPWRAIYLCWYSPAIYREAASQWRGLGYQYLVGLLICLWSIAAIHVQFIMSDYISNFLRPVLDDFPALKIKNGVAGIDKPGGVYQVRDRRNGKLLFDFDMRSNAPTPDKSQTGIYFRRNGYMLQHDNRQSFYDYGRAAEFKFDKQPIERVLKALESWSGLVILGVFWLASFLFCAVQVLVYALSGKLLAVLSRRRLNYSQLVRLSVIAITPSLIIDTLQKLFSTGLPAWTLTSIILTIGYLNFGIRANTIGYTLGLQETQSKTRSNAQAG